MSRDGIDELLEDLRRAPRVWVELRTQVSVATDTASGRIRLEWKGAPSELVGEPVILANASGVESADVWRGDAVWTADNALMIKSARREPREDLSPGISRTSRRIKAPPGCAVRSVPRGEESPLHFDCLDLSAGGLGLQTEEKASVAPGDPIEVVLEVEEEFTDSFLGHVAYVRAGGRGGGMRLGVQFDPLSERRAEAYYVLLNRLAGETVVDAHPTADSAPAFFRALEDADTVRLVLELEGDVLDEGEPRYQLRDLSPAVTLADRAVRLRVDAPHDDNAWSADLVWDDGAMHVRQVSRWGTPTHARQSGYRISAPRRTSVVLRRLESGQRFEADPIDLSRGGLGVWLPQDQALRSMERVGVELTVPGRFHDTLPGRIVHVAPDPETGRQRVGVAYLLLSSAQREALHETLSALENAEILKRVATAAVAMVLFLVVLVVVGGLLVPK